MIISTSTKFTAALLPDGGAYGIQHAETECWVARWDGTPARWPGLLRANLDAAALGRGERPRHCLDILAAAPATRWECPEPGCTETSSEPGDCRLHEGLLAPVNADCAEVARA